MKRKTDKEKAWEALAEALAIYLSTAGWSVLVVSHPRIHGPLDEGLNFDFVVQFTGKQYRAPESSSSSLVSPLGVKAKSSSKKGKD